MYQAVLEREPDLAQRVDELNGQVNNILRRLGFVTVSLILAQLSDQVTLEAKKKGSTILLLLQ